MALLRLGRILRVALRYRLDTFTGTPRGLRRLLPAPQQPRGERLRLALEALGPIFVKFGQLLSTRRDLLPPDIADELALLQDRVPPFPAEQARARIETALGAPVTELFAEFEDTPLASASVAQVHCARLHSGEAVVVKVLRPGIEEVVAQDLRLLHALARRVARWLPEGRRLRPVEVVREYEHTINGELDLCREGANTSQLRRNFAGSDLLYIPEIHWDYTRRNVLVMERINGIPVSDVARIRAAGIDLKSLAERGVEIFFTQVFRDSFFHADMHPGNIMVAPEPAHPPRYIGIDCAIIGSLSESDQYYLARNLLAMFRRDYREVAQLHVECGWVPAQTPVHEFEAAIRTVCEPIFEKPLGEISFGQTLVSLFQTARRFDMEVQPSLVLLQKTLLNVEGLGRELYPQLDLWSTAQPFLERWLWQRYGPKQMLGRLARRLPGWLERLPGAPDQWLDRLADPAAEHRELARELRQWRLQARHREQRARRLAAALALAAAAVLAPAALLPVPSQLASLLLVASAIAIWPWRR